MKKLILILVALAMVLPMVLGAYPYYYSQSDNSGIYAGQTGTMKINITNGLAVKKNSQIP